MFADGEQTVLVRNVKGDAAEDEDTDAEREACMNGGWKTKTVNGTGFENQGDCVSGFATGGKSAPSGM